MKIPTAEDIRGYQETAARIREACALLKCTPETLVERVQDLQTTRESLTLRRNEMNKQLEATNANKQGAL